MLVSLKSDPDLSLYPMWTVNINDKFKEIKEVQSQKFLGIIIDKHLHWNTHTNSASPKKRPLIYLKKISTVTRKLNRLFLMCFTDRPCYVDAA